MILVFGSINIDLVAQVPAIARPGETVLSRSTETRFGGKGANQAVAAARARRDAGLAVRMVGAIGADGFGRSARENLMACGVEVSALKEAAAPTGWACIAVNPQGENAITVASGANMDVRQDQVPDAWLGPQTLLVLQMEVPPVESLRLARRTSAAGGRVLLNLAPAPADLPRPSLETLLQATDILVVNEHEAAVIERVVETDAGAGTIAARYGLVLVTTRGAQGVTAVMPNGGQHQAASLPVRPVDTTGAGDTFVGVLATSLAEGVPLPVALQRAAVAGSLACLALGAQAAMPDAAALDAAQDALRSP